MPSIPMSAVQIADDLAARIKMGEYPPGSRMPTHRALAELYGVGMTTMTVAMGLLRDRGLTVGSQGRAVYVADGLD